MEDSGIKNKRNCKIEKFRTFSILLIFVPISIIISFFDFFQEKEIFSFLLVINLYIALLLVVNIKIYGFPYFLNPFFSFLLGTFLFITLPPFIDDVDTIYDNAGKALFATFLGLTGFTLGWFSKIMKSLNYNNKFNKSGIRNYNFNLQTFPLYIFFIFGLALQYISIKATKGDFIQRIIAMRSVMATGEVINIWETFWRFPYSFSFGFINSSVIILIILSIFGIIKKTQRYIVLVLCLIAVIINFATGTRMQVFTLLFPIVIAVAYRTKNIFYLLRIKRIIYITMVSSFILFLIALQTNYRYVGLTSSIELNLNFKNIFTQGLNQLHDFQRIFDFFPEERNFLYGYTFLALLVNFIPREFWVNKPVGIGAIMGDVDLQTRAGTSISITIFGELYANFWYIGVFIGLFIGGYLLKTWFIFFLKKINDFKYLILYLHSLPFIIIEVRGGFLEISMAYIIQLLTIIFIFKSFAILSKYLR